MSFLTPRVVTVAFCTPAHCMSLVTRNCSCTFTDCAQTPMHRHATAIARLSDVCIYSAVWMMPKLALPKRGRAKILAQEFAAGNSPACCCRITRDDQKIGWDPTFWLWTKRTPACRSMTNIFEGHPWAVMQTASTCPPPGHNCNCTPDDYARLHVHWSRPNVVACSTDCVQLSLHIL